MTVCAYVFVANFFICFCQK